MSEFINRLTVKKNNYIMNNLLGCLFELNKIVIDYKENIKLVIFEDDYKISCVNEVKKICNSFCVGIRNVATSVTILSENGGCSDKEFCEHIIRAIFQIKKHKPNYVKNYIKNSRLALQEEDFRDTLGLFFSSRYDITSEGWRKEGRTDLMINVGNGKQKVIEFKIWGRNDYKEVVQQIIERYLTEFDDTGFVFMINSNKTSITDKYIESITERETGYIIDALKV